MNSAIGIEGDLEELEAELQEGRRVDSKKVPSNVVTMNSRVRGVHIDENKPMDYVIFDVPTGKKMKLKVGCFE